MRSVLVAVLVVVGVALSACTALITDNRAFLRACAEGEQRIDEKLCYGVNPTLFIEYYVDRGEGGGAPTELFGSPIHTGERVRLFAYAVRSRGSEGQLTLAWDLDGDGEYDDQIGPYIPRDPFGQSAHVAVQYFYEPGDYVIGLKVTDGARETTTAQRLRVVDARAASGSAASASRAKPAGAEAAAGGRSQTSRFSATLSMASFRLGELQRSAKTLKAVGLVFIGDFAGKLLKRSSGRAANRSSSLRGLLSSSWLTEMSSTLRHKDDVVTSRGLAMAKFKDAPGAACVRYSMRAENGRGRGRMRLLGGTGQAQRLAATARFGVRARVPTNLRLRGTIASGRSRPRDLPAGCERLTAGLQ